MLVCDLDPNASGNELLDVDLLLQFQETPINEHSVIQAIGALHEQVHGCVVIGWDGLPAHRSKLVKAYIQQNQDWLTVERLPAYAPDLNPPEYAWSAIKGKDTANLCPDSLAQIEDAVLGAQQRFRGDKQILLGFLNASPLFHDCTLVKQSTESQ
jgi:putative transposase